MQSIKDLEHWIEFRSKVNNRVERTRARRYIERIKQDFKALEAKVDEALTPLDEVSSGE